MTLPHPTPSNWGCQLPPSNSLVCLPQRILFTDLEVWKPLRDSFWDLGTCSLFVKWQGLFSLFNNYFKIVWPGRELVITGVFWIWLAFCDTILGCIWCVHMCTSVNKGRRLWLLQKDLSLEVFFLDADKSVVMLLCFPLGLWGISGFIWEPACWGGVFIESLSWNAL